MSHEFRGYKLIGNIIIAKNFKRSGNSFNQIIAFCLVDPQLI